MLHHIRHHRARLEAIALAIIGVVLAHLALVYELHEKLDHLAHEGGGYGIDQLFIAIIIAGILGFVFGVSRFRDLRREISRRRQAERQTLWAARHDALTGLQNRQGLEEIATADCSTDCLYAVFSIDLAGFKRTNDLVGHAGGDELLVNIARRLEQIFAAEDVYRPPHEHGLRLRTGLPVFQGDPSSGSTDAASSTKIRPSLAYRLNPCCIPEEPWGRLCFDGIS